MRKIRAGEVVSVDIAMNHHGYLNDQTRNFCIGTPPPGCGKPMNLSGKCIGGSGKLLDRVPCVGSFIA